MSTKRIKELEAEVARLKKIGRTKREPLPGIAGALQSLREGAGLGIQELGRLGGEGVSAAQISHIESGHTTNPHWKTIKALAKGLSMPTDKLVMAFERAELEVKK